MVGYDGTHIMQFNSPAFSKPLHQQPEMTVSWGGLQGTLTIDANNHWVGTATVPSLASPGGHR